MATESPPSKDPKRGLTRLHDLEPAEVSLVPSGANRRRFLVLKTAEGKVGAAEKVDKTALKDLVSKTNPALIAKTDEVLRRYGSRSSGVRGAKVDNSVGDVSKEKKPKTMVMGIRGEKDSEKVEKDKLTTEGRDHIADDNFALPETRGYPIHDMSHARNALARASGKPEEGKVKAAVYRKYPSLKEGLQKAAEGIDNADPAATSTEGSALDAQTEAAAKAVVRILSPFKGKMPAALAHELVDLAGLEDETVEAAEDATNEEPESMVETGEDVEKYSPIECDDDEEMDGVKKSHLKEGAAKANAVYKEHMEKLGYQKYPEAQLAMKTGGYTVEKTKGEHVSKSAESVDTNAAPDLSGVDPKTKDAIELVFKAQKELIAKNALLETSNAELAKRLDEQKAGERKRELVAKAAGYTHLGLPQEDIVSQLLGADKLGKESLELVVKSFDTLNEQARSSKLFGEIGSALPFGQSGPDNAWAKIEAAAAGWVQKSGVTCTKAEATDKFLQTVEGQRLYADYKNGRKDGI